MTSAPPVGARSSARAVAAGTTSPAPASRTTSGSRTPRPGAFGQLVADAGRRYGFTVVSLSLLRPLQTAPVLFVETGRDRTAFMHDLPAIENMLDPGLDQPLQSPLARKTPLAFEGLFFEVRDAQGPFLAVWNARRGAAWGDQWSWLTATLRSSHG